MFHIIFTYKPVSWFEIQISAPASYRSQSIGSANVNVGIIEEPVVWSGEQFNWWKHWSCIGQHRKYLGSNGFHENPMKWKHPSQRIVHFEGRPLQMVNYDVQLKFITSYFIFSILIDPLIFYCVWKLFYRYTLSPATVFFFLKGGGSKYIPLTQLCLMFYEHEKMFWFRMFYFVFQGAKKTRGSLKNTENKKKMLIYCQDQKKLKPFFEKQGMRYYPSIRLVVTVTLGKLLYFNLLWWPM